MLRCSSEPFTSNELGISANKIIMSEIWLIVNSRKWEIRNFFAVFALRFPEYDQISCFLVSTLITYHADPSVSLQNEIK